MMDITSMLDTGPLMGIAPFVIPAALATLGFLGGALKKKQTSTSTTGLVSNPLLDYLRAQQLRRLQSPQQFSQGEIAGGVGGINRTFDTINQGIGNRAASSGVSGGAGERYALNNSDISRGGQIGNFQSVVVPGIERQLQQQEQENALGLAQLGDRTSTTTGTSGGGLGGGLAGAGGMLGFLYGQGLLGGGGGSSIVAGSGLPSPSSLGGFGGGGGGGGTSGFGGIDFASLLQQYTRG